MLKVNGKLNDTTMKEWMGRKAGRREPEVANYSNVLARYLRADSSATGPSSIRTGRKKTTSLSTTK